MRALNNIVAIVASVAQVIDTNSYPQGRRSKMKPEYHSVNDRSTTEYHSESDLPVMMTIQELAKFLRVSRNTAYSFVNTGVIPSVKIGRQTRIYREDVIRFVQRSQA